MSNLKISIITPSYNQAQFLEETIQSVINQNYSNIEYIIIDGGSIDNSVEIIKKYKSYLTYWVSEKDNGQSEAINKGFKKASGNIICWLNSDDIFMPGALQNIEKCFKADPGLDFVNGASVIIDKNSNIITGLFILKQKKRYARHGIYYVNQPAMFWKREIFKTIGLLKEDYQASMDREFLIRIFEKNYKIGHINQIIAGFRIHSLAKSAGGPENKKYFKRDKEELFKIYNGYYRQEPQLMYKVLYGLEKLQKGLYFKKWLFTLKWKGKSVKALQNIYS